MFVNSFECRIFFVFIVDFPETAMWADTSSNFFPVAAFRTGVFWACANRPIFTGGDIVVDFIICTFNLLIVLSVHFFDVIISTPHTMVKKPVFLLVYVKGMQAPKFC